LEKETIDGEEVARLVDEAYGRPVHANGDRRRPALKQGAELAGSHATSGSHAAAGGNSAGSGTTSSATPSQSPQGQALPPQAG